MEDLEREVRLLVPAASVDLSSAKERLKIRDLYFQRTHISIRVRAWQGQQGLKHELTFKFWHGIDSVEETLPIDDKKARRLLDEGLKAGLKMISKLRHVVASDGFVWEIDRYTSPLDFFVIAECEYKNQNPPVEILRRPAWYRGSNWDIDHLDITKNIDFFDLMLSGNVTALRRYITQHLPAFGGPVDRVDTRE